MNPILSGFATEALLPVNSITWVGILGRILIFLAGLLSLTSFVAALTNREKLAVISVRAASAAIGLAFASLITLFATSQFQYKYVQKHSAIDHEIQYKIAGTWSGQEGSFLLWAVGSALFVSLAIGKAGGYKRWFAGVSSLFLAALAGILAFESPFVLNPPGTDIHDGFGLPPSLLNYWVVIHPPTIFMGFGCLTALFAWSVAAMLHRDLDSWIDQVRPWALIGLSFTGVGLCMGGFWAYETLGWGGFWAWDPVENTSFVPWALLTVFVHGMIVQKARKKWHLNNIVFGALPFLAFVYGTFLTRSGFLGDTSVHSFANMDRSALWILVGLGLLSIAGFLAVYLKTAKWWKPQMPAAPQSDGFWTKDNFYSYANWLLVSLAVIASFGMSVPLVQSLRGEKPRVVEETLYNTVSAFPFIPIIALMAIAPFLTWRKEGLKNFSKYFLNLFSATIAVTGFTLLWIKWGGMEVNLGPLVVMFPGHAADPAKTTTFLLKSAVLSTPWILSLFALCVFAIIANLTKGFQLFRQNKLSAASMITHIGVVLTLAGLIFSRGFEQKVDKLVIHESKTISALGYTINFEGRTSGFGDRNNKIKLRFKNKNDEFLALPGLYYIPGQDGKPQEFIWPYIHSQFLYDTYIVVHSFAFDEQGIPDFGGSVPTSVLPGQTADFNGYLFTYQGMKTEGTPGTFGAKFITTMTVHDPKNGDKVINPYVKLLGPGELERPVVEIGHGLGVYVDSINAADKSATFVIKYMTPAYPVEIYYKPLTILVWWGVGIMTFGGTLAAFYRRNKKSQTAAPANAETQTDATENPVEI
ncbi:MAG: cytochrome c biogenesis protein CcsA [Fimbriimonadaceae bacterium]